MLTCSYKNIHILPHQSKYNTIHSYYVTLTYKTNLTYNVTLTYLWVLAECEKEHEDRSDVLDSLQCLWTR